jgi:hypothetical protein
MVSFCHHQDKWLQHCMFVLAANNNKNNATLPLSYKCLVLFSIHSGVTLPILIIRDRRDRDRMVVGFTTTCAIRVYPH